MAAINARMSEIDAVGLSIMWDRLIAITDEIVSTLVRTSFSTIVSESYDLTVVLLDAMVENDVRTSEFTISSAIDIARSHNIPNPI